MSEPNAVDPADVTDAVSAVDVVLSAERIRLGTRRVPVERVRLRREVVSSEVTVTVTVRREVLRVEREPLTPDDVLDGPGSLPDDELPVEFVLSQERPVVSLEVVPYERVHLAVRSRPTTTQVSTTAAREVLDLVEDSSSLEHDPAAPRT